MTMGLNDVARHIPVADLNCQRRAHTCLKLARYQGLAVHIQYRLIVMYTLQREHARVT